MGFCTPSHQWLLIQRLHPKLYLLRRILRQPWLWLTLFHYQVCDHERVQCTFHSWLPRQLLNLLSWSSKLNHWLLNKHNLCIRLEMLMFLSLWFPEYLVWQSDLLQLISFLKQSLSFSRGLHLRATSSPVPQRSPQAPFNNSCTCTPRCSWDIQ